METIDDSKDKRNFLYCLFPIRIGGSVTIAQIPRNAFIKTTRNGEWSIRLANIMNPLLQAQQEWENKVEIARLTWRLQYLAIKRFSRRPVYGKGRRF